MGQEQNQNLGEISVIIPTLDAAGIQSGALVALGAVGEIVIVDACARDGGFAAGARDVGFAAGGRDVGFDVAGVRLVRCQRGRGVQLATGIAASSRPWLLLLHDDTRLSPGWRDEAARFMAENPDKAGYFRLRFDSVSPRARRVERLVAWRCRWLGLPYGDQGLLLRRTTLAAVGGMRAIPLMEDVDLARRLGRRLAPLMADAITSPARYERDGWTLRPLRNLICLALYFLGLPPRVLARLYE